MTGAIITRVTSGTEHGKRCTQVKIMKRFDRNIRIWLVGVAVAGALAGQSLDARAEDIAPPTIGTTLVFECGGGTDPAMPLTLTVKSVEGEVVTLEFSTESEAGLMVMPLATLYLGFTTEKTYGNNFRKRKIESGTLTFERLEVGQRVKAWVRQIDSRLGSNRWRWTAEIKEKIRVEVGNLGPLEVYVIEQELYSSEWNYGATLTMYYSPETKTPVYWHESDTNNRVEECRLISLASPSAQDGIPEGSRWTASGESRDGSRILATATRRGDTLKVVFDVDHRAGTRSDPHFSDHYTQSCTISVADPVFECWIPGRYDITISAKVFGTFPRLQFSFQQANQSFFLIPGDIVLDFRPEP
jgi:hypothetical protein